MANVIFDFDGTLADTFPLIVDVAYELSPRTKRRPPQQIEKLRKIPLLESFLRLGIPWINIPHLIRNTRKKLTRPIVGAAPFAGVPEMLQALHKSGHRVFILSSNYPKNIVRFLEYNKLEAYVSEVSGVPLGNTILKSFALRSLARRHGLKRDECYHVGNEKLDMHAARMAGMKGIAVTWSGYDRQKLARSEPFAVIDKPLQLLSLLQ